MSDIDTPQAAWARLELGREYLKDRQYVRVEKRRPVTVDRGQAGPRARPVEVWEFTVEELEGRLPHGEPFVVQQYVEMTTATVVEGPFLLKALTSAER